MLLTIALLVIFIVLIFIIIAAFTSFSISSSGSSETMQFASKTIHISERAYMQLQKNTSRVNICTGVAVFVLYACIAALFYNAFSYGNLALPGLVLITILIAAFLSMAVFILSIWLGSNFSSKSWQIGGVPLFIMYILLFPVTQLILWFRSNIAGARKVHPAIFNLKTIMNSGHNSIDDIDDLNLPAADQEIYQNAMEFPSLRVRDCMM